MQPGKFMVIRVDGTEETFNIKPTIRRVSQAIGAPSLDTVRIGKNPLNGPPETIMFVDDIGSGMSGGQRVGKTKPVNIKATELYHSICRPGILGKIYGDVAICNDEDFA